MILRFLLPATLALAIPVVLLAADTELTQKSTMTRTSGDSTITMSVKFPKTWTAGKMKTGISMRENETDKTVEKPWLRKAMWLQVADQPAYEQATLDFAKRQFEASTKPSAFSGGMNASIRGYTQLGTGGTLLFGQSALYWDFESVESDGLSRTANRHIVSVYEGKLVVVDWFGGAPADYQKQIPLFQSILDSWTVSITKGSGGSMSSSKSNSVRSSASTLSKSSASSMKKISSSSKKSSVKSSVRKSTSKSSKRR